MTRSVRLSRDHIVATALDLLDRRGSDALTIRNLAQDLGSSPMALYRHVQDREDLVSAIADHLLVAPLQEAGEAATWQDRVRAVGRVLHGTATQHPGAVQSVLNDTPPGFLLERVAAAVRLDEVGLDTEQTRLAFSTLLPFILGWQLVVSHPRTQALAASGRTISDLDDVLTVLLTGLEQRLGVAAT